MMTSYLADKYYPALSASNSTSPFLSPVRDPEYVRDLVVWLIAAGSRRIGDVGVGYGEVVEALGATVDDDTEVWAIDACIAFLERAQRRWPRRTPLCVLKHEIAAGAPARLAGHFDRLSAINVLQDLDLAVGLCQLSRWLRPGGQLRATVLAKETMDRLYTCTPLYDRDRGLYFKPSSVDGAGALGRVESARGPIAYERVLRFYTLETFLHAARGEGLELVEWRPVTQPAAAMLDRWRAGGTLNELSRAGLHDLVQAGVYVDSYDVILRCARSTA
jgi:SAM-dependent methyltransferase